MTEANKSLEKQYLEARSNMQHSETVIARLKQENKLCVEKQTKAEDVYQETLEKFNDAEQLLRKRQATALEL